jgi:hypothetical protein
MHSGSGMLLGSLRGYFNVGELKWFWSDVITARRCSCGDRAQPALCHDFRVSCFPAKISGNHLQLAA